MKENKLNQLLMISGMFGLLILAFVFDLILQSLVDRNVSQGGLDQWLVWMFPLLELLLAVAAVGLVWLIISSTGYGWWISLLFIVVGLLVLYSTSLLFVLDVPETLYVLIEYLSPGTMLYQASAVVAAIGLFSLAMWKPADTEEDEQTEESPSEVSRVSTEESA